MIWKYNYKTNESVYRYLNFDLTTGKEIQFEDLFSKDANLTPILIGSFINSLSTDISFEKLYAEQRLAQESVQPDPSICMAQFCPYPGETYDSIRALIAKYNEQLANIEQYSLDKLQKYLDSSDKKFYLKSYGPVFILPDQTQIEVELKDNIRYAVYLKNFRTSDSIYDNNETSGQSPFFTESFYDNTVYFNTETDTYLLDYMESVNSSSSVSSQIRQGFREFVKSNALAITGDSSKFRHFYAYGTINDYGRIRTGEVNICAEEMDKSYYISIYKKAIIDGKTQDIEMVGNQPARIGHYDESKITKLGGEHCGYGNNSVAITSTGKVLEDINDILTGEWKTYLSDKTYAELCYYRSYSKRCYTEEQKQKHQLTFKFANSSVSVYLRETPDSEEQFITAFYASNIPQQYFNPEILIN